MRHKPKQSSKGKVVTTPKVPKQKFIKNLGEKSTDEDSTQRRALVETLKRCRAEVGEKPTRKRTYAER